MCINCACMHTCMHVKFVLGNKKKVVARGSKNGNETETADDEAESDNSEFSIQENKLI